MLYFVDRNTYLIMMLTARIVEGREGGDGTHLQALSRVKIRPVGRLMKCFQVLAGGAGSCSKCHGSDQECFLRSHGSGRVRSGRVGSGHVDHIRPARGDLAREKALLICCLP